MPPDRKAILVTGATGYIGGLLAPRLLALGHRVRCAVRDPARLEGRGLEGAEIVRADVLDASTLPPALEGIHTAYYLIHSMRAGEKGFEERDREAARAFGRAARLAGVSRIVYLGGLGGGSELSPHLRSRIETGDVLRASGVPVVEFRAAIIVGPGSISFEMIRALVDRLPFMICPRWVNTRCQPIAVDDVLEYLVQALDLPEGESDVFEIGGADILTYREMMLAYARIRGKRLRMVTVPVLTPRLSSYWVDLVTPIPASLSRPLIEGMRSEVICRDARAARRLGVTPLSYEEAVRRTLARERSGRETIWSGSLASLGGDGAPGEPGRAVEGALIDRRVTPVRASPARVFAAITRVGGDRGWPFADRLWQLRGFLDRLVGGVGMRRGRRDPDSLRPGDALDFWRVERVDPDRLLRLRAEMKLPGRAWLLFEIAPAPEGASLTQTAVFLPGGFFGLLYWYLLYPAHILIFGGMLRALAREAERAG